MEKPKLMELVKLELEVSSKYKPENEVFQDQRQYKEYYLRNFSRSEKFARKKS